ncbi:MAG: site-specific integrase [Bifidobacteriaceae bacterium]|jgi:site-specific recombinase XerD|nr:site-specific integrase [Bifidobacteriaceae bacterium]
MGAPRGFADMLARFLTTHLPVTRGLSPNTVASYRDAFVLFLRHMAERHNLQPDRVGFEHLTAANVNGFVEWLRQERGSSPATTNQRLAAVKSFFRHVQAEAPELIAQARQVLGVEPAKTPEPQIVYLPLDGVALVLELAKRRGLRDLALLATLYDTGARVQEVCDLAAGDLHLDKPASVTLTGKGRKTRTVPLTPQAAEILARHASTLPADPAAPVFTNHSGQRIGRAGVAYVLAKCAEAGHKERPDLVPAHVTPHSMRHSKAVHLLENGVNLVYIRDILGHASVTTTEIYARASPETKRRAVEAASAKVVGPTRYPPAARRDLITWLRDTI